MTTRFFARIYILPPEELKKLLTMAFEAGRDYRGGR